MTGHEETVKDCLPEKIRSKMQYRKKRFKEGKRDFRKSQAEYLEELSFAHICCHCI